MKPIILVFCTLSGIIISMSNLANFVKQKRKQARLTQSDLAQRAGVGLRFIRELERGKRTIRLDKVDQVLRLFGHTVGAIQVSREETE